LVSGVDKNPTHAVELLKKEYYATKSFDVKETCLRVLAWVTNTELLKVAIIPFNFNTHPPSNAVPSSDMHILDDGFASNVMGRALQWQYKKDHWKDVSSKLGNAISMNRYIGYSLQEFTDESSIEDINAFFKTKDTHQFQQTLDTVRDKIRARAALKKRDSSSLKQWLTMNGYI
jgi:aminopeptidase N